jgi:hypothetical protein
MICSILNWEILFIESLVSISVGIGLGYLMFKRRTNER